MLQHKLNACTKHHNGCSARDHERRGDESWLAKAPAIFCRWNCKSALKRWSDLDGIGHAYSCWRKCKNREHWKPLI